MLIAERSRLGYVKLQAGLICEFGKVAELCIAKFNRAGKRMVKETLGEWHPLNEKHAIAMMTVSVSFAQPVPDLLLNKILKNSEQKAFDLGLKSQQPSKQLTIGPDGIPQVGEGIGHLYNGFIESSEVNYFPPIIAEQLQIDKTNLVYRTWQYQSWKHHSERIRKLMTDGLELVKNTVSIATIRLEYRNQFKFAGDLAIANIGDLLSKDSNLIAPYVFSMPDLWHSHTGAFIPNETRFKRLQQLMIDVLDQASPQQYDAPQLRWINITTALEDRLSLPYQDDEGTDPDSIFATLDVFHDLLTKLLESVITKEIAERINLGNAYNEQLN